MKIRYILAMIWQCTWGILQTLAGFFVFLRFIRYPHKRFRGSIATQWKSDTGISLGLFIFYGSGVRAGNEGAIYLEKIQTHEYGHCIQSLILGPLYLLVIGIPSVCWANVDALERRRRRNNVSYYSFYPERWANALGTRVTGHETFSSG
ncbi:MAG: hypothetical protein IJM62_00965 [Lachnospiraceae bacterium]|nr:hypothetical protein [Lachnospiraceae bacterium]